MCRSDVPRAPAAGATEQQPLQRLPAHRPPKQPVAPQLTLVGSMIICGGGCRPRRARPWTWRVRRWRRRRRQAEGSAWRAAQHPHAAAAEGLAVQMHAVMTTTTTTSRAAPPREGQSPGPEAVHSADAAAAAAASGSQPRPQRQRPRQPQPHPHRTYRCCCCQLRLDQRSSSRPAAALRVRRVGPRVLWLDGTAAAPGRLPSRMAMHHVEGGQCKEGGAPLVRQAGTRIACARSTCMCRCMHTHTRDM
jgi:hypothetical protein